MDCLISGISSLATESNGNMSKSTNQLYKSPNADCPASSPSMPGMMEPLTCPQIPFTSVPEYSFCGTTTISQVEVPVTFTMVNGSILAPTAPACASMIPVAITTSFGNPRFSAHSLLMIPATVSDSNVLV